MSSQPAQSSTPALAFRLFLFWMVLFQFFRALFLLNAGNSSTESFAGWPWSFIYGMRLDFSATCYLMAVPLLLLMLQGLSPKVKGVVKTIVFAECLLVLIILLANIQLYKEWGTLLNRRAITFVLDPAAIIASLSTLQIITLLLVLIVLIAGTARILTKFVFRQWTVSKLNKSEYLRLLLFLLVIPVGIRGGLQQIPINESAASFSSNRILNSAAMNPPWYLANNVLKSGLKHNNIYKVYSDDQATVLVKSLFLQDSSLAILNTQKPNIVFIVLESWTADIIEPLGGDSSTTPFFSQLVQEGLLFTNIYSSGRRTDQMFPSVLSGYPAQADHSIIRTPSKTEKLPMLSRDLKKAGYSTSFYYGGEAGFANMRTYLLQGEFQSLTTKENFTEVPDMNKWGAHDQYLLQRHAREIANLPQPFFSFALTLSTHEPFDVPGYKLPGGASEPEKFRNAATYTDQCLKAYFNEVKKLPLYQNTLFVLVADHGHLLPRQRQYNEPAVYHIPLLVCGGALKDSLKGKTIPVLGSQHDLPATILHQLGIETKAYHWSNDLLMNKRYNFAYLNMDDATGWLEDGQSIVWYRADNSLDKQLTKPMLSKDDSKLQHMHAYLQRLYDEFLEN